MQARTILKLDLTRTFPTATPGKSDKQHDTDQNASHLLAPYCACVAVPRFGTALTPGIAIVSLSERARPLART